MDSLMGIAIGIGLSAACGFRIFVPLLILNLAVLGGYFSLSPGFEWLGTTYATLVFTTATIAEIIGYYVPWFDSVLDTIATPAAVIAGTITTASMVTDISPFLKWTLAIIAGGGIAGLIQGSTVALRTKSSLATGGVVNPWIATLELVGAVVIAILALVVPIACLVLLGFFCIWIIRKTGRLIFRRSKTAAQ